MANIRQNGISFNIEDNFFTIERKIKKGAPRAPFAIIRLII